MSKGIVVVWKWRGRRWTSSIDLVVAMRTAAMLCSSPDVWTIYMSRVCPCVALSFNHACPLAACRLLVGADVQNTVMDREQTGFVV